MSKIDISKVQVGDWVQVANGDWFQIQAKYHSIETDTWCEIENDFTFIVSEIGGCYDCEIITDHRKEPPEEAEDDDQHEWLLEQIQRCQVGECSCRWLRNEIEKRWMLKSELQRDLNYAEDVISELKAGIKLNAESIEDLSESIRTASLLAVKLHPGLFDVTNRGYPEPIDIVKAYAAEIERLRQQAAEDLNGLKREVKMLKKNVRNIVRLFELKGNLNGIWKPLGIRCGITREEATDGGV